MKLFSTRDKSHVSNFKKAIFQGLAPDGGLYFPQNFPDMKEFFLRSDGMSFNMIAEYVVGTLLNDEISEDAVKRIVDKAFHFKPEIQRIHEEISIMELFHGPTCAFKDYGASFLAASMEEVLEEDGEKAVILTATSGDTGSAVAKAFEGKENIDVVILYPSGRVSPLQEKQLTTIGKNIKALEVKGSFDDCQRMVKEAFENKSLNEKIKLTSANSINIGRLVPQSLYYIYAFSQMKKSLNSEFYFTVPSGNFGNLSAGLFAWHWGLPVNRFIAATNANSVVPEYLESGIFTPRASVATHSNAMDVGNPSNFERMMTMFDNNVERVRAIITGDVVTDDETIKTMQRYYKEKNVILDPHTAVGVLASERFLSSSSDDGEAVVLSTAHPGKFVEVVEYALGVKPQLPDALTALLDKEKKATLIGNSFEELESYLLKNY